MLTILLQALAAYLLMGLIVNSICVTIFRAFDDNFLSGMGLYEFIEALPVWPIILLLTLVAGLVSLFRLLMKGITTVIEWGIDD